jgi:hypothetical protein
MGGGSDDGLGAGRLGGEAGRSPRPAVGSAVVAGCGLGPLATAAWAQALPAPSETAARQPMRGVAAQDRAIWRAEQMQRLQRLSASLGDSGVSPVLGPQQFAGTRGRRALSPPPAVYEEGSLARRWWDGMDEEERGSGTRAGMRGDDRLTYLEAALRLLDKDHI